MFFLTEISCCLFGWAKAWCSLLWYRYQYHPHNERHHWGRKIQYAQKMYDSLFFKITYYKNELVIGIFEIDV